ncbi:MAG: hypothetical protein ACJZZ7_06190 [Cytophagales bacterium]
MKKITFFLVIILSSNNIFSQRLPSIDELMRLFEENNYTCSYMPSVDRIPIEYEELYSIYGYDVEDDVSELRKAVDDFCECYLPKYYDEFDKINIELIRLIKNIKENGFEDFQFTSVLAKQVFINLGIIPSELEFNTFPLNVIEKFKLYGFGAIDTIDGTTSGERYFRGGKSHREPEPWFDLPRPLWYGQSNLVGYSVIQEHDLFKSLDEFKEGDKTVTKIFFGSKDELVKSIYYELVFQKLDNYREWVISDWEKKVICEYRKNTCGECVDKIDIYAETKFKRGQYKVFLKETDEQAAAGTQNKNDYVDIIEIILNTSDDINGIYSYTSWRYDSQNCEFSSGEIKNENTVGFTLECLSEGNTYDAGSYSIEIIDEGTLRWKSDDGSFEKVFNYTFIPIE